MNSGMNMVLLLLAIMAISAVIVGVAILLTSLARRKGEQDPQQPVTVSAQVLSRRTIFQQSTQQAPVPMNYYVTFLTGNGDRMELCVNPQQYAMLPEGICGSLTYQGTTCLAFTQAQ